MAEPDARRFEEIGAGRVRVLGNLKLDRAAPTDPALAGALRRELGLEQRPVFIAGSVREGEEGPVLDAVIRIATKIEGLYSIIAPRHPDRVAHIRDMAAGLGVSWAMRSSPRPDADLLIVDTMGELSSLYGVADCAFVGGSLTDLGGQNILEPVAWGVPTLHGPYMDNFSWALEAVRGRTLVVNDPRELAETSIRMLSDREGSRRLGLEARQALEASRGVTGRYMEALERYI